MKVMRATVRMRDESGLVLPLALIMVVLVGVMGAGLLTFVITDQTNLLEVNQGQDAFEMADTGIKVAKMQLKANPSSSFYTSSNDWSDATGKDLSMDGDSVNVKISPNTPSTGVFTVTSTGTAGNAKRKAEATFTASGGSSGGSGVPQMVYGAQTISGSRIGIDGSANTSGTPPGMVMYSKGSIAFDQQDLTLKNASVFSGGDISLDIQNSRNIYLNSGLSAVETNNCGSSQNYFTTSGTDPYGNWVNSFNSTARTVTTPGMGALGVIRDKNDVRRKPCGWGTQFFDKDTDLFTGSNPKAEFNIPPSSSSRITFPFNRNLMEEVVDASTGRTRLVKLTEDLKSAAKAQTKQYTVPSDETLTDLTANSVGNYIEIRSGASEVNFCSPTVSCGTSGQTLNWPPVPAGTPASQWPVIYVKFVGTGTTNTVNWRVQPAPSTNGSSDPVSRCDSARTNSPNLIRRGILVVEDGSAQFPTGVGPLDGGVITRSNTATQRGIGFSTPDTLCIRGPVIASGTVTTQNFVGFGSLPSSDFSQLPGFGGTAAPTTVTLQDWRELYN